MALGPRVWFKQSLPAARAGPLTAIDVLFRVANAVDADVGEEQAVGIWRRRRGWRPDEHAKYAKADPDQGQEQEEWGGMALKEIEMTIVMAAEGRHDSNKCSHLDTTCVFVSVHIGLWVVHLQRLKSLEK